MKDPIQIIAEIAQGYEGSIELCEQFVRLAKKSGANGVKFQIFEATELSIPSYKYHSLFETLFIEPSEWKKIIDLCNEIEIDFYADVFGAKTLKWMLDCDIAGIKIHSTDVKNYELLKKLKDNNIRIILGVGGSTLLEIEKAIKFLGNNEIIIMSGFQAEPNLIEDIELHKLPIIKKRFQKKVGYADHIEVQNPLTKSLAAMAVLMGADYIEKHLTIDRDNRQLEDYISALNDDEFMEMANLIRDVEQFPDPQSTEFNLTEREEKYRKNSKKVVLASRDLEPNTIVTNDDVVMLRTGEEYNELLDIEEIIGNEISEQVEELKIIRANHLK